MENNIHNEKLLAMVKSKIYTIRGQKVMFDFDLAQMYGVETRVLNQAVKRNIERFPEDFMFQLTKGEYEILKSQILALQANKVRAVISNIRENEIVSTLTSQNVILKNGRGKHSKYIPYAFTENGVAMLSSVLRSMEHRKQPKRRPIGFIQPKENDSEDVK